MTGEHEIVSSALYDLNPLYSCEPPCWLTCKRLILCFKQQDRPRGHVEAAHRKCSLSGRISLTQEAQVLAMSLPSS